MALVLWSGRGIWKGWQIRKQYQGCKFGDSVLVDPNGNPYNPHELLAMKIEKSKNLQIKE